jgi:hypothetical protein
MNDFSGKYKIKVDKKIKVVFPSFMNKIKKIRVIIAVEITTYEIKKLENVREEMGKSNIFKNVDINSSSDDGWFENIKFTIYGSKKHIEKIIDIFENNNIEINIEYL